MEQGNNAYTLSHNLQARLNTPVLQDNINLWRMWLDSRTMQLYGGVNEDNRYRFKIDHSFDLSAIVNANINYLDGSVIINQTTYSQSQGTEFIIISSKDLNGANKDYAMKTDKYGIIRSALNKSRQSRHKYDLTALIRVGGFAINSDLDTEEIISTEEEIGKVTRVHDGWLELAVGKNNAKEEDYSKAEDLLKRYVTEARKNECFVMGIGMRFFVGNYLKDYKVNSWCIEGSLGMSDASVRYLSQNGRFLVLHGGRIVEHDKLLKLTLHNQAQA